jgi:hypothetical protein
MAFQKEKTLLNGAVGNYWRVSFLQFSRNSMTLTIVLDLYKDSTPDLAPLGKSHTFQFIITQQEVVGNLVAWAYTKMRTEFETLHNPISGEGEPASRYPDLVGALDV